MRLHVSRRLSQRPHKVTDKFVICEGTLVLMCVAVRALDVPIHNYRRIRRQMCWMKMCLIRCAAKTELNYQIRICRMVKRSHRSKHFKSDFVARVALMCRPISSRSPFGVSVRVRVRSVAPDLLYMRTAHTHSQRQSPSVGVAQTMCDDREYTTFHRCICYKTKSKPNAIAPFHSIDSDDCLYELVGLAKLGAVSVLHSNDL